MGEKVVEIEYDPRREMYLLTVKSYEEDVEILEDIAAIAPVTHPELLAQGFGHLLASDFSYATVKKVRLPEDSPHYFSWRYELEPDSTAICELPVLNDACEYDSVYLLAIPR